MRTLIIVDVQNVIWLPTWKDYLSSFTYVKYAHTPRTSTSFGVSSTEMHARMHQNMYKNIHSKIIYVMAPNSEKFNAHQ